MEGCVLPQGVQHITLWVTKVDVLVLDLELLVGWRVMSEAGEGAFLLPRSKENEKDPWKALRDQGPPLVASSLQVEALT